MRRNKETEIISPSSSDDGIVGLADLLGRFLADLVVRGTVLPLLENAAHGWTMNPSRWMNVKPLKVFDAENRLWRVANQIYVQCS